MHQTLNPKQTPIPSSIQKLLRAKRLHEELEGLYYTYLQSKPYDLVATADPSVPGYRVTTNHTPPPMEMALIFGDFVHNLRSALDHHARALVIDGGGIPNDGPGGTMFPAAETKPPKPLALKAKSGGALPSDLSLIESVQPYSSITPKQHPLSRLSLLDNIDKHRHINVIAMAGSANVAFFPADQQDIVLSEETPKYLVSSGASDDQIVRVAEPLIDGPVVARGMHVSHLVLDEPSVYPTPTNIMQVCGELHDYVAPKVFGLWFS
ncbi:hypothetical protein GU243_08910 [Pseudarthrobacter psychrotolerans]|uniref:Uncharacterized protein n=1 Tax=Pseudarthrobacter psychrotolerans TaxID=2697569 RepID=A0A6P1NGR9_9MICC|nr:hypothetical protein [Pseudarthrobacter psychrotolerans]QHK19835.1 hypothetical protein GU243_08910 [Pseudarthrobacter psychrotolerans]